MKHLCDFPSEHAIMFCYKFANVRGFGHFSNLFCHLIQYLQILDEQVILRHHFGHFFLFKYFDHVTLSPLIQLNSAY